jgi:serine/threonine-protein kinase RsbW
MENHATVRLELESRPESLTLVRGALAGVGETLGFDSELLDDVKTAVSEACNNVVLHAYSGEPGPLLLYLEVGPDGIEVLVRDRGGGFRSVASSEDRMGVGLAVIGALSERAEFLTPPDGGTEVRMSFAGAPSTVRLVDDRVDAPPDSELSGDVVATLSPVLLLGAVLGRVTRALAAGARFSLDRFSDVYLVTDAIAAHAERTASNRWMTFAIGSENRRLELTVGPFRDGSSSQLQADDTAGRPESPLALLADELAVEGTDGREMLRVVLIDHHRSGSDRAV